MNGADRTGDVSDRSPTLRASLRYLTTSDDWIKTAAIGGFLTLFGVLVVPAILATGYFVRVLRAATDNDDPPAFDDWSDLAGDGAQVAVIGLVYAVVLAVTTSVLAGAATGVGGEDAGSAVGGLLAVAATAAFAYVFPAAVVAYAERGTARAGFDVVALRTVVSTRAYAGTWLRMVTVVVVTGVVAGLLGVIPLLGAVAGAVVSFYGAVVACHFLGGAWGDIREMEAASTDSATAIGWAAMRRRVRRLWTENGDAASAGVGDLVDLGAVRERIGESGDADSAGPADPVAWNETPETGRMSEGENTTVVKNGGDHADADADVTTRPVSVVAARPIETFDAADIDTLVSGLDAGDPETVVMAARALIETAGERPGLLVDSDSDAMSRLRDLRLSETQQVRTVATKAVRRFEAAGLS